MLAGDSCSTIKYLFLIHALLPYVGPWYKQTGSDSSWLQSHPAGRNTVAPDQGSRAAQCHRDRQVLGQMQATRNRWLLNSNQKEARRDAQGQGRAESLKLSILCHSLLLLLFFFFKRRCVAKKEKRRTKEHKFFQVWTGAIPCFLSSCFFSGRRGECIWSPCNLQACLRYFAH